VAGEIDGVLSCSGVVRCIKLALDSIQVGYSTSILEIHRSGRVSHLVVLLLRPILLFGLLSQHLVLPKPSPLCAGSS
jgi:hypothetical protein